MKDKNIKKINCICGEEMELWVMPKYGINGRICGASFEYVCESCSATIGIENE